MVKALLLIFSLFLFVTTSTGCASIVSRKNYPVAIASDPSGAAVEIKDKDGNVAFSGITPATANLDSGNGYFTKARYVITTSKPGYTNATRPITASMDGWYFGNILFGGLIGMLIVDPLTGAMFEIDEDSVTLNMTSATPASATAATSAPVPASMSANDDIAVKLMKLKSFREDGILTEAEYQAKRKALIKEM